MAQEFSVTTHINQLGEVARESWLHCHVLRRWVDLPEIAGSDLFAVFLFWQLLFVEARLANVVKLHWPVETVDEANLEVRRLDAREHNRFARIIEDWVLRIKVCWQSLNFVKLVIERVVDEDCRILLVNKHLTEVAVQQELFVLVVFLFLLLLFLLVICSSGTITLLFFFLFWLFGIPKAFVICRLRFLTDEDDLALVI